MPPDAIQSWLKKKLAMQAMACWGTALLALLAGALVLFLTFWLAYAVLFVSEWAVSALGELIWNRELHLTHVWRLALCGCFLVALFAEWLRRSPWDLGNYPTANVLPGTQALVYHGGVAASFAVLLANPQAPSTMLAELLYTGPRLVVASWHLVRQAFRFRRLDLPACAGTLALLAGADHAVTWENLAAAWPGADWPRLRNELGQVPGVVVLEKGLSLTEELRQTIRSWGTG